jgi:hypothetical protein
MLDSFLDLPLFVTGTILIGSLCLYAIAGVVLVRRHVLPRLRIRPEDSDFVGALVQAIMVFYGLAVALIAVSVWETYADVGRIISAEASRVGALYRDVSSYPQPTRGELQQELRGYLDYVIQDAWLEQRAGRVPQGGVEWMDRFQAALASFEPSTEGQKLLHGETLRAYNLMIEARRLRLDAVLTRLPGVMWFVIGAGAVISLSSAFFFHVDDVRLHGLLVVLLALFIGLIVFMVAALDRPFHGDLGVSAEPYQLIYEQLVKP